MTDSWPEAKPPNDNSARTGDPTRGQQGSEEETKLPASKSVLVDNTEEAVTELARGVEEVNCHAC